MSLAAWTLAASGVVNAGLLAWLLVRWRQINQKVRRAKTSETLIPVLDEARHLTRLLPGIRLKLTEDSMSPAVCGLFRPVILLPQSLVEKLSAGQLRAVLLHEAIHLRRGDVWVNCAQALLQIVYWWHPLLWLANARIRRVREEAVDDAVMLALRDDAEIYAPTLLEVAKLAFNRPLASLGLVGILESRSALRQRIERLVNFNAPRKAGLTVVSILGILAFSAVALPMGEAPEKTNAPNASVSNSTIDTNAPENVFKAGTGVNTVRGLLSDTNFLVVLHALEQRTGTGTVAEPEPVTSPGQSANQINRMVVPDKIDIPTITTNAAESAKLVQDGKLLYEMGKFDEAGVKLNQALKLDPDNQGAFYFLSLVKQAKYAREDPNNTNVKLVMKDASLHDALNAVVMVADRPIRYTVEDYAVVISPKPSHEPLEMRTFRVDSRPFFSNLITAPGVQSNNIATMAESLFRKHGADLTAPGRSIAYNDKLGLLFVRATASEMDTVERIISALNQVPPQIHIKARFIEVEQDNNPAQRF